MTIHDVTKNNTKKNKFKQNKIKKAPKSNNNTFNTNNDFINEVLLEL